MRSSLACALAALLLAGPVANAASPVSCNLVVDARGDAQDARFGPMADDADFDILGADVATNGVVLTAVIRVAQIAEVPNPAIGTYFAFFFSVDGFDPVWLQAQLDGTGPGFSVWEPDPGPTVGYRRAGSATGVVDVAHKEVRLTFSTSVLTHPVGATSTLSGFRLDSDRWIGGDIGVGRTGTSSRVDEATSGATYRAGAASCVVVGK